LKLIINLGGAIANSIHGIVNSISPFDSNGVQLVDVCGADGLYGSRALVSAVFNAQVDPSPGITVFAAFIDFELLSPTRSIQRSLIPGIEKFLRTGGYSARQFCEFLRSIQNSNPDSSISRMSKYFEHVLSNAPKQMSQLTAYSFRNAVTVLDNDLSVYISVGSIRVMTSPNVVCQPK
jgi:hypothetical protein